MNVTANAGRAARYSPARSGRRGAGDVRLGDLVAVTDIDARYNMGYRRRWVTIGIVVHGSSPLPGHGPGMTPILTAPGAVLAVEPDDARHVGLTERCLKLQGRTSPVAALKEAGTHS